jgi:phage-related protein
MMTSPGGKQVGQVRVKVVPDTSKFAKELKAKLEEIEKSLKLQLAVELDTAKAVAQAKALKEKIESDAIDIPVHLNTRGANFARQTRALRRAAAGLGAPLLLVGKTFENIAKSIDRTTAALIRARRATGAIVSQTVSWAALMVREVLRIEHLKSAWQGLSSVVIRVGTAISKIPSLAGLSRALADLPYEAMNRFAQFTQRMANRVKNFSLRALITEFRLLGRDAVLAGLNITRYFSRALGSGVKAAQSGLSTVTEFIRMFGRAKTYTDLMYRGMNRFAQFTQQVADTVKKLTFRDIVQGFRNVGRASIRAGRNIVRNFGRAIDTGIKAVGSGLSGIVRGVGTIFTKAGSAVSGFAGAIASMSRVALIATAVIALLAPVIGLVVALLAAIPSGIMLLAAPIAAIALGLDGIKAAAKAAEPAFNRLREAVSATFEKSLTPVFKRINDVLLPGITKGMQGVAEGVSGVAKSFVDVLTSAEGMRQINSILGNVKTFLVELKPFVTEFTSAFLTLAEEGSKRFGGMAQSMGEWARGFNEIVKSAAETGRLQAAFEGLGKVVHSLGSGFNRLFDAGLTAMEQLGGPLSTLLDGFFDLLESLMPALTDVAGLIGDVLGKAMTALAPIIDKLTPAFGKLVDIVGKLLDGAIRFLEPLLSALADVISGVLMPAFDALSPVIDEVVDFLVELATIIGDFVTKSFQLLMPFIEKFTQFMSDLLIAVTPLLPKLLELAELALDALFQILTLLMPVLMDAAEQIFPMLLQVIQDLVPVVLDLLQVFVDIAPVITDLIVLVMEFLVPVLRGLLNVVQDVWPQIQGIITGALDVIKGSIELAMGLITMDWGRAWEGLKSILKGAWEVIYNTIKGSINLVLSLIRQLPGDILSALGNLGGLLVESGRALIRGFINGIRSMIGSAASAAKSLVDTVRGFFPFSPAKVGPFSGKGYTTWSGKALVEDFAKSIRDTTPVAVDAMNDLMSAANGSASAEWNGLIRAEGFGALGDRIAEALNGMEMKADGHAIAKVVNKENKQGRRR